MDQAVGPGRGVTGTTHTRPGPWGSSRAAASVHPWWLKRGAQRWEQGLEPPEGPQPALPLTRAWGKEGLAPRWGRGGQVSPESPAPSSRKAPGTTLHPLAPARRSCPRRVGRGVTGRQCPGLHVLPVGEGLPTRSGQGPALWPAGVPGAGTRTLSAVILLARAPGP